MSIQYKLGIFAAVAMLASAGASAASYTVWLKNAQGQPYELNNVKCATGTADTSGTFTMSIAQDCFSPGVPAAPVAISGSATVHAAMIQTNVDNAPVSSADGITYPDPAAVSALTLTYSPSGNLTPGTRNFAFSDGTNAVNGTYHLFNVTSIPEPGTLWLALAGLGGLFLARRKHG